MELAQQYSQAKCIPTITTGSPSVRSVCLVVVLVVVAVVIAPVGCSVGRSAVPVVGPCSPGSPAGDEVGQRQGVASIQDLRAAF